MMVGGKMAFEVVLPRLGWSMEVGSLEKWDKKDGDSVQAGETLFTAEGEKAVQEVEALESGILHIPADSPQPGEEIQVGTLLGYILGPDEAVPAKAMAPVSTTAAPSSIPAAPAVTGQSPAVDRGKRSEPAISPRARRVAKELEVDWTTLQGSGSSGRIVERDIRQATTAKGGEVKINISPVARRLAESTGINLSDLATQMGGKKIMREDVQAAIDAGMTDTAPAITAGQTIPVTQTRRIIARRMAESGATTAPLTLNSEADATGLVTLREQLKATLGQQGKVVPTYNDLMIKLTGIALQEHPMLNAIWKETEIFLPAEINIGNAVDTEAGLMVPVIRDVQSKSVQKIAAEARDLAEKARSRQLNPDFLQGGTFTLTNLGMYNVDNFTPIINLPECAILGVGRIIKKPAVWNGQVVPRDMMALSLTFDHRIVDGGPAARFLNTVREYVEQPYSWLTA
jgi:pyruvate dehydrogenase E2 component (dihydrolipoamide acetyltransferase)